MQGIHRLVSFAFLAAATGFSVPALAAPVEYVKVCSTYGANYYYSLGTETCINANTGCSSIGSVAAIPSIPTASVTGKPTA